MLLTPLMHSITLKFIVVEQLIQALVKTSKDMINKVEDNGSPCIGKLK